MTADAEEILVAERENVVDLVILVKFGTYGKGNQEEKKNYQNYFTYIYIYIYIFFFTCDLYGV